MHDQSSETAVSSVPVAGHSTLGAELRGVGDRPEAACPGAAQPATGGREAAPLDPVSKVYAGGSSIDELFRSAGWLQQCERPVLVVDEESGETIGVRCGSRRVAECSSCAALYSGDASAILRSGALDVDPTSTIVMLTLTAPSFGAVHRVPKAVSPRLSGKAQEAWIQRAARTRCRCGVQHAIGDRLAGVALDMHRYDYEGQAAWNAAFGQLWNRTATKIGRALQLGERLPYAGTTEWQARGVVHAHFLVRLPARARLQLFTDKSGRLRSTSIEAVIRDASTSAGGREFRWGTAVVAEVISAPGMDAGRKAKRTIGYLRKALGYTVKDIGGQAREVGTEHFRRCRDAGLGVRCPHCRGGIRARRCRSPRHRSLGYAGHAFRKSRSWSDVTFTSLRRRRRSWHQDDAESSLPVRKWRVVGRAHIFAEACPWGLRSAPRPSPLAPDGYPAHPLVGS